MKVKLKDIFNLQMGKTPSRNNSEYWNGDYKWISIKDISNANKYIYDTKEKITAKAIEDSKIKSIPANTVIMSFKLSIGKTSITKEKIYTNEAIMAFIDKKTLPIDINYIYYLLSNWNWNIITNKAVMGLTLNKSILSNLEIDLPSFDEQKKIANILDKVANLIELRKKQLEKLDIFSKALFVEMFGDPVKNSMNWKKDTINNLCKNIIGGGTPSRNNLQYFSGNIPWISPKDMKTNIIFDSKEHITLEAVNNSSTKIIPSKSILMVIRSGILKHTLPVAININEVTINQDMKAFVPSEKINNIFLLYLFKMMERNILSKVRSVTADNIDFNGFKKNLFITPPIELQNQFAKKVEHIDKIKLSIQDSLTKLETLKKSLMQEYFS